MKRDGRKLAHNTLEDLRILAVTRMSEGEHPAAVAASLGWPRKLPAAQERLVFDWVNGKRPDEHGFEVGLWTRQIVRELVLARFGVELSLASIGALLARLGLTPQKPLERAYQRDAQAVERWKLETFPAIAREASSSWREHTVLGRSGLSRRCGAWQNLGGERTNASH